MPKNSYDIAKIKRIMTVLSQNADGVWLRRLSKESKVPLTTVHDYLRGVLAPFVDNLGARDGNGNFFGVRIIRLKPGILRQLEQGLTVEKLIKTRTIGSDWDY